MTGLLTAVVAAALACSALTSCSPDAPPPTELLAAPLTTPQQPAAQEAAGRPTRVVDTVAGSLGRGKLAVYGSTDGATGAPTKVSGAFFVPSGTPPAGGWPTIAIGHGTTGLSPDCGPSRDPATLSQIAPVAMLLKDGFAVALIDYQGLGIAADGTDASADNPRHPYLEPRSAAYNLADAVRAMRAVYPGRISTRWAAAGHSQGGQAAWAAAEFAPAYASELQLVAASAQAPAVNLRRLGRVSDGSYTSHEEWLMPMLITGLSVSDPSLNRWDFIRGSARNNLALLVSCNAADDANRQKAMDAISSGDVIPDSADAQTALTDVLQSYSLPQRRSSVPLYVTQGTADPVVAASSTTTAVSQACQLGTVVTYRKLDGRNHDIGDDMAGYEWLATMLHGARPPTSCTTTA
ncbi:lipase [Gordonia sp. TBRC 11910]|uniref:Lipase n=1 Tax=Gordonia asplenii TaxID=2725283 RepID=A0A848KW87_9ACTN|nr:lipase [Gordonia asplenii]